MSLRRQSVRDKSASSPVVQYLRQPTERLVGPETPPPHTPLGAIRYEITFSVEQTVGVTKVGQTATNAELFASQVAFPVEYSTLPPKTFRKLQNSDVYVPVYHARANFASAEARDGDQQIVAILNELRGDYSRLRVYEWEYVTNKVEHIRILFEDVMRQRVEITLQAWLWQLKFAAPNQNFGTWKQNVYDDAYKAPNVWQTNHRNMCMMFAHVHTFVCNTVDEEIAILHDCASVLATYEAQLPTTETFLIHYNRAECAALLAKIAGLVAQKDALLQSLNEYKQQPKWNMQGRLFQYKAAHFLPTSEDESERPIAQMSMDFVELLDFAIATIVPQQELVALEDVYQTQQDSLRTIKAAMEGVKGLHARLTSNTVKLMHVLESNLLAQANAERRVDGIKYALYAQSLLSPYNG